VGTDQKLLTIEEVAEMLSVSVATVRKWKSNGLIPYVKLGGTLRFLPSDISEVVKLSANGSFTKDQP